MITEITKNFFEFFPTILIPYALNSVRLDLMSKVIENEGLELLEVIVVDVEVLTDEFLVSRNPKFHTLANRPHNTKNGFELSDKQRVLAKFHHDELFEQLNLYHE